ncbi:hypothetical protein AXF42_Ash009495 [Apostasia shenzhenica]|uniref:Uncharacterized protein n=1 Tax=Apostasia shenzhenica TaxID=1088818 RepID=A0A2I0B8Z2_9ASPA|nr:hypothetical protein AXF42_Ash009495 [Apostasia shenzhenica]
MGKNQAYKAMQRARLSGSAAPEEVEDGMVDGAFHSPEWHAARLASLNTSHTITWEEFKRKQKEEELKKGELEADKDRMMREYRAQLDADRARKLAVGRNHSGIKLHHKKAKKDKDSKKRNSRKRKHKRRSSSSSSCSSSSESSSSDDDGERESRRSRSKSRSKRAKKEKRHRSKSKHRCRDSEEGSQRRERWISKISKVCKGTLKNRFKKGRLTLKTRGNIPKTRVCIDLDLVSLTSYISFSKSENFAVDLKLDLQDNLIMMNPQTSSNLACI